MAELNTSIDTIYSKMNEYIKDLPTDLFLKVQNESFEMFDQFEIESDIQKLLNDDKSILIRILRKLFPNWYNKRVYTLFNRYFSKMPNSVRMRRIPLNP